mmetsp:Transcript_11570/g.21629  ORF Transcript_11570/g.21629 Transcript_11570/m.21629 type:complete len:2140 (-) Transcript_11570:138-6557(-)
MPRSRASSPANGKSSNSNEESAMKFSSPSVAQHPGLIIPSPGDDEGDGSQRKKFKYTKPRIGSYFQAKVGPFISQNDKDESEEGYDTSNNSTVTDNCLGGVYKKRKAGRPPKGMKTTQQQQQQDSNEFLTYDPTNSPKRGGMCIHRPASSLADSHDEFLVFSRNLCLQTPKDRSHAIERAEYLWKNALENDCFKELEKVVVKEKKRGRKRKLADKIDEGANDVGVASSNNLTSMSNGKELESDFQPYNQDNNATMNVTLGLEDDELMLQYLQIQGSGQVARAQFLTLVHLCRGTAVRTRRRIRRENRKRDIDDEVPLSAVLQPFSHLWRRRYERNYTVILGDHRRNGGQCSYPYFEENITSTSSLHPWSSMWNYEGDDSLKSRNSEKTQNASIDEYWRDYKNVEKNKTLIASWNSILEKSQFVLDNCNSGHKPKLRDLCLLLKKAYSIPSPEDVFGKRDVFPKRVSQCLNTILDFIENGREISARITDAMYEHTDEGVDLQALSKLLVDERAKCNVDLDEIDIAQVIVFEGLEWEKQLDSSERSTGEESSCSEDLHLPSQSLSSAEEVASRGRLLSVRPNSLVSLERRIHSAYELRNKIRSWNKNNENDKDSVKNIGSMIKEANKINLSFPELSLLSKVHKDAEEWMDRANVALRSKISLKELESLVKKGEQMPLGLTGALDKLQSRYKEACEWISDLKEAVPCPIEDISASGCDVDADGRAEWFSRMRNTLDFGDEKKVSVLLELSCEGSRLPVDSALFHLLQIAVDARNWSLKAKKWIPTSDGHFKKGKIEDLQDHLENAEVICEQASELTDGKADCRLQYLNELQSIVDNAEQWFETYRPLLMGDNRRSNNRTCCAFTELKKIVEEAQKIPSNLGNSFIKINRIYNEAELWMDTYKDLLERCGINSNVSQNNMPKKPVTINEVSTAIERATKDLAVDLDEVKKLEEMVAHSQYWFAKASDYLSVWSKLDSSRRNSRNQKFTVEDVVELIEKSEMIPLDTSEDVKRLKLLLNDVKSFRKEAQRKFEDITDALSGLVKGREDRHGNANEFLSVLNVPSNFDSQIAEHEVGQLEMNAKDCFSEVNSMVEYLLRKADSLSVCTFEEVVTKQLFKALKWCEIASAIIDNYDSVFVETQDKHLLDELFCEVPDVKLATDVVQVSSLKHDSEMSEVLILLESIIAKLLSDDLCRLNILRSKRKEYIVWCEKINDCYFNNDKRVSIETLISMTNEGRKYPQNADMVKRLLKDSTDASKWIADAKLILEGTAKYPLEQLKSKLDNVSGIKFTCPEYKKLKKAYSDAKNWLAKVKKCGLADGSAQIHELRALLKEHEDLLIESSDEVEKLQQALCGYCICRRPYEGFMIGCDDCGEWYHGPCIGVTQAQGDKMEKYVCLRCSVKRIYETSCNKLAAVIRKWCDKKELSKARSQDNQKHQRKVREKKREIEKLSTKCQTNIDLLKSIKRQKLDKEAAKLQAAAAEDQLTLGVPKIHLTDVADLSKLDEAEALANSKLSRATVALEEANRRFAELNRISTERKRVRQKEDMLCKSLRYWVVMIKSTVLVPNTMDIANKSRPMPSSNVTVPENLISVPMSVALETALKLGISEFPDVSIVRESFLCIGWCCLAFEILKRKPKIDDLRRLSDLSNAIDLPEVKSVQLLKSIICRTSMWQGKVRQALTPIAGDATPFDMTVLKELGMILPSIPVITPEEGILINAIADEGARHCVCGSPRDDAVMICCSSCNLSFHPSCLSSQLSDASETWKCPTCQGKTSSGTAKKKKSNSDSWPILSSACNDISPHAPVSQKLWPPFGLVNSLEARNILGNALSIKLEDLVEPSPKNLSAAKVQKVIPTSKGAASFSAPERVSIPQSAVAAPKTTNTAQHVQTYSTPKRPPSVPKTSPSVLAARFPSPRNNFTVPQSQVSPPMNGASKVTSTKVNGFQENVVNCNQSQENTKIQQNKIEIITASHIGNAIFTENGTIPLVEGLPNGLVEDAVLVARAVAENIDIAHHPTTDLGKSSQEQSSLVCQKFPFLSTSLVNAINQDFIMSKTVLERDNINLNCESLGEEKTVFNATTDVTKDAEESISNKTLDAESHPEYASFHAETQIGTPGHESHGGTPCDSIGIADHVKIHANQVQSSQTK